MTKKADEKPGPAKKAGAVKPPAKTGGKVQLAKKAAKPSKDALVRALKQIAPGAPVPVKVDDLVEAVRVVFAGRIKEVGGVDSDRVVLCTVCGEMATDDTTFCPFCGFEGELKPGKPPQKEQRSKPPAVALQAGGLPVAAMAEPADQKETAEQKFLDLVRQANDIKRQIGEASYEMGLILVRLQTEDLWKAGGFRSFKEACEISIGISRTTAYDLMTVVRQYSKEDFLRIGLKKLMLVDRSPDQETRERAMEAARAGSSATEIAQTVRGGKIALPEAPKPPPAPEASPVAGAKEATRQAQAPRPEDDAGRGAPVPEEDVPVVGTVAAGPLNYPWRDGAGKVLPKHAAGAYCDVPVGRSAVARIELAKGGVRVTWLKV